MANYCARQNCFLLSFKFLRQAQFSSSSSSSSSLSSAVDPDPEPDPEPGPELEPERAEGSVWPSVLGHTQTHQLASGVLLYIYLARIGPCAPLPALSPLLASTFHWLFYALKRAPNVHQHQQHLPAVLRNFLFASFPEQRQPAKPTTTTLNHQNNTVEAKKWPPIA